MMREKGGPKETGTGRPQSPTAGFIKYVSGKEASAADRRTGFDDPGVPQETRKKEMKTIPLTQGKVAFVSDCRFEELNQFKWHAYLTPRGTFYARRTDRSTCRTKTVLMYGSFTQEGPATT